MNENNTGTEFICYSADSIEGMDDTVRDIIQTPDDIEDKDVEGE